MLHGKNDFVEISKNLIRCRSENNLLAHQNNYVRRLSIMSNALINSFIVISIIFMIIITNYNHFRLSTIYICCSNNIHIITNIAVQQ